MNYASAPSTYSRKMVKFLDVLISEVKKRPILWDKNFKKDANRRRLAEEWHRVSMILNKPTDEIKRKWRNLRDTFHREEKKVQLPLVDEGYPPICYYSGQWEQFEKLQFLFNSRSHTRSNDEYFEPNESYMPVNLDNIKEEMDMSDNSNDYALFREEKGRSATIPIVDTSIRASIDDTLSVLPSTSLEFREPTVTDDDNLINVVETKRKRTKVIYLIRKKQRAIEPKTIIETDADEKMLVEALVPYLKKLNPIRKMIVSIELQKLLLKELLCEECKTNGLKVKCDCYFK